MEESPLTLAHVHATQASQILASSQPPHSSAALLSAAASHLLAATSFTAAAKLTRDPEAIRTLELLSKEHERWEAQLRREAERPAPEGTPGGANSTGERNGLGSENPTTTAATSEQTPPPSSSSSSFTKGGKQQQPPKDVPAPPHSLPFANTSSVPYPPRLQKSGSSLATNLASARGIQLPGSSRVPGSQPQSQSQSPNRRRSGVTGERVGGGGQALLASELLSSAKPTTNPLALLPPDEPAKKRKEPAGEEDGFNRFYSSLNTFVSRIGSPFAASLAFAGLPLVDGEDDEKDKEAKRNVLPKGWVEKNGRGRGLERGWPTGDGGGESFYVVPVSGGTLSYAGVVRRDTSPQRQPSTEDSEYKLLRHSRSGEATSLLLSRQSSPPPPHHSIRNDQQLAGHHKTKEELQLENTGLRQTIDHMSRTMQSWQRKTKESENMLKNSIMAFSKTTAAAGGMGMMMNHPNGAEAAAGIDILNQVQRRSWLHVPYDEPDDNEYSEGRHVGEMEWERERERDRYKSLDETDKDEKIARLKQQLENVKADVERLSKENEELSRIVSKFRKRWDKLKEGARNKRSSSSPNTGGNPGAGVQLTRVDEAD